MWLQAAGALLGAGLSYFGENDAANKRRKAKETAIKQLEENMYSPGEQRTALDNIRDAYDTNIASETNNAAFGLNGVLNSNSAKSLVTSRLLGQRASSELQAKQQMTDYNKRVGMEIAGLEAGTDTSVDPGAVLQGGFLGMNIGDSVDKIFPGTDSKINSLLDIGGQTPESTVAGVTGKMLSPKLANIPGEVSDESSSIFEWIPKKKKSSTLLKTNMFGRL